MSSIFHLDHPEDERYDEINIRVVERWKESELSGDEWRFSYVADVNRKGEKIIELASNSLENLLKGLSWNILISGERGMVDTDAFARTKDKCDQPGCKNGAVVFYKRLKRFTKQGDELMPVSWDEYRQFCAAHHTRGDCGLDDADNNYEPIQDPKSNTEGVTNG
jgi:hypothetical protein